MKTHKRRYFSICVDNNFFFLSAACNKLILFKITTFTEKSQSNLSLHIKNIKGIQFSGFSVEACYGLNCLSSHSRVEALISSALECGCVWRWEFKEVIKVKWGHKGGGLIQYDWCPYEKRKRHRGCMCTEKRPCEYVARRQPSAGQGERPQQKQPRRLHGLRLLASRTVRK